MIFPLIPWLIAILLINEPAVQAQSAFDAPFSVVWSDNIDGLICHMGEIQSVILNDHIYFMGIIDDFADDEGDDAGPTDTKNPSQFLFSIALNETSTIGSLANNTNLRYSELPNGTGPFKIDPGRLWTSDDALYTIQRSIRHDGEIDTDISERVMSFNPNQDLWTVTEPEPTGQDIGVNSSSLHSILNIPQIGMSLFFNAKEYVAVNYSHTLEQKWTAQTYDFPSESGAYPNYFSNTEASYFFIPVGRSGLVISMGGNNPEMVTYDQISVLDIDTNERYLVLASGIIPQPPSKRYFCGWVAAASDNSSYSVITYYNYSISNAESIDHICQSTILPIDVLILTKVDVLSLPSFVWVLVHNRTREILDSYLGYSCHQLGKESGFLLGRNIDPPAYNECGSIEFSLLNLSTLEWVETYEPDEGDNFLLHESIYEVIGGNEFGGATKTAPAAGWHTSLEAFFAPPVTGLPAPSSAGDSPDEPFDANPLHEPRSLGITSIAGAAVGGFLGLALVVALIWWNLQRQRQRKRQLHAVEIADADPQHTGLRELEHHAQEMPSDKHLITTELPSEPRAYEMWAGRTSCCTENSAEGNVETNVETDIYSNVERVTENGNTEVNSSIRVNQARHTTWYHTR